MKEFRIVWFGKKGSTLEGEHKGAWQLQSDPRKTIEYFKNIKKLMDKISTSDWHLEYREV